MNAAMNHVIVVTYEVKIGRKWEAGMDVYASRDDAEYSAAPKRKLAMYRNVKVIGTPVYSAGIFAEMRQAA
jgi:hypothetical protein